MIQALIDVCDGIIVLSSASGALLRSEYRVPRGRRVEVIHHGHYIGCYPNTDDAPRPASASGIPAAARVVLSLGRLQPYKGLEELLAAFGEVGQAGDVLLLAGKTVSEAPTPASLRRAIERWRGPGCAGRAHGRRRAGRRAAGVLQRLRRGGAAVPAGAQLRQPAARDELRLPGGRAAARLDPRGGLSRGLVRLRHIDWRFALSHAHAIARTGGTGTALDYAGVAIDYHVGPAWLAGAWGHAFGGGLLDVLFGGTTVLGVLATTAGMVLLLSAQGLPRHFAIAAAGASMVLPATGLVPLQVAHSPGSCSTRTPGSSAVR
jgi:hypothetical protein